REAAQRPVGEELRAPDLEVVAALAGGQAQLAGRLELRVRDPGPDAQGPLADPGRQPQLAEVLCPLGGQVVDGRDRPRGQRAARGASRAGAASAAATRSLAPTSSGPVGRPSSSLTGAPSAGSGAPAPTPARASRAALARAEWWSWLSISAGLPPRACSSAAASARPNVRLPQVLRAIPVARTSSPRARPAACARRSSSASSNVRRSEERRIGHEGSSRG